MGEIQNVDASFAFGRDDLGPAIAGYLSRLHAQIIAFEKEHGARTLFVSRAGVRIRRALDAFVEAVGILPPQNAEYFWISRLVAARGVWNRDPDRALDVLSKEFRHIPLPEFMRSMFRFAPSASRLNPVEETLIGTGADLRRFMQDEGKMPLVMRRLFQHQGQIFEAYVAQLLGRSGGTALLIDTGWQATAQTLLAKAFPEHDWWGAYFGRSGFAGTDRSEWARVMGLVFEADTFDPARPETCPNLNRHLIEFLFEPAAESIKWLTVENGKVIAPESDAILADAPTAETDPMYAGVMAHLQALPKGVGLADLYRAEAAAWQRLARVMVHPTKDDVDLFANVRRSADFGRDVRVPLLPPPVARFDGDTADLRIKDSLWPCGQAAVEYPIEIARALQKRLSGGGLVAPGSAKTAVKPIARNRAAIAIITRTMDRPMFLERALASVAAQTFHDYIHVIINDGGDNEIIKETIARARCNHARVRLINGVVNRGMEAASNLAIRNSDSDFIVIHDDDDSWEPEFLAKTVAFLDGKEGKLYGGVIAKSTYVSEEVTPDGIVVHGRDVYNGWVENVHLMEMAIGNFFPPIAFVFRREIWDRLGGYNEDYPVLGDWDFNLRFLIEADIAVLPERLANYHHRDRGDVTTFGNSVIAGRSKHLEYSSIVRNNLVRSLVARGHPAAATLAGVGLYFADQRTTLRNADNRMSQLSARINTSSAPAPAAPSPWADNYWAVFQRLVKAVAENDTATLDKIRMAAGESPIGIFARVGMWPTKQAAQSQPVTSAALDRAAAILLREFSDRQEARVGAIAIPPDFDEKLYLQQNPDVAVVVEKGQLSSGYEHYISYGRRENRRRPTRY
jgi:GT2 family glycosyltransferase